MEECLKAYLLCHNTKSRYNEKTPLILDHRTQLKEHSEVLNFCHQLNFSFEGNLKITSEMINSYKIKAFNQHEFYPILSINDFSKTRKKFSILIGEKYSSTNNINVLNATLYVWTNDLNSIINYLKMSESSKEVLKENSKNLQEKGFQLMYYCKKEMTYIEKNIFLNKKKIKESSHSLNETELDDLYNEYETDLEFLSGLFCDYELKPAVFQTINNFKEARIKLHLISEDDEEKVMCIAYKTNVINPNSNIKKLIAEDDESLSTKIKYILNSMKKELIYNDQNPRLIDNNDQKSRRKLRKNRSMGLKKVPDDFKKKEKFSLVLNGKTLELILNSKSLTNYFKFILLFCSEFIGFELLPAQKKLLVNLVKTINTNKDSNIIAIGNNNRDYLMMQESNVSFQIHSNLLGKNLNADICFHKFQYLSNLIFVYSKISLYIIDNILSWSFISGQIFLVFSFALQINVLDKNNMIISPLFITLILKNIFIFSIFLLAFMKVKYHLLFLQKLPILFSQKTLTKNNEIKCLFSKILIPSILIGFFIYLYQQIVEIFDLIDVEYFQFEVFAIMSWISYSQVFNYFFLNLI